MTKNQLINQLVSLKTDLKYLKKDLQFRLEGNDIEGTLEKYKDPVFQLTSENICFFEVI